MTGLTGYWLFVYLYGQIQSPRSIVPVEACETGALTEGFVFHPCSYTNSQYPVYYLAEILKKRDKNLLRYVRQAINLYCKEFLHKITLWRQCSSICFDLKTVSMALYQGPGRLAFFSSYPIKSSYLLILSQFIMASR